MQLSVINGMRKQFFSLGLDSCKNFQDTRLNYFGRMAVGIVNLSFACELCLKELHYRSTNLKLKGHDLKKLYDRLSEEQKKDIMRYYYEVFDAEILKYPPPISYVLGEQTAPIDDHSSNFEKALNNHTNYFENYRYYFEPEKLLAEGISGNATTLFKFDFRFFIFFYKAIAKGIDKIKSQ